MKFYNIVKKETYSHNGEEKARWHKVGTLKQTDEGKMFVEVPAIGLNAYVFEQEDKSTSQDNSVGSSDAIDPNDIPFN